MTTSESSSDNFANDNDNFISTYLKLPEKATTTIRFFDRGEKYAVYGSDAEFAAQEILGVNTAAKKLRSLDKKHVVEYFNVSRSRFERFVRELLLVKQYRVEVWSKKDKWVVEYKGSPGNLSQFEELIFSNSEVTVNNGVIGVKISNSEKSKIVGVGNVNTNEGILNLVEFVDNDAFTNFESVLVQLAPKEAVVACSSSQCDDGKKIAEILQRNNVLINEQKAGDFETKDLEQDLRRLVKSKSFLAANPELEKCVAAAGLAAAIKYLDLTSNESYLGHFSISPFDFGLYVKMDSAACQALHLSQNQLEIRNQQSMTIGSVVDKCRTAQGHRLLAQFLRQPLLNKDKLEERLDLVEVFVYDSIRRASIYDDHLRRVPDYQMLARKFMKKKATLQDCYKSYLCLVRLPKLIEDLDSIEGDKKKVIHSYFLDPLMDLKEDCSKFVEMIESTLDLSLADQGEFMIRPDFDEKLQALRNEMDRIKAAMEKEAQVTREKLNAEEKTLKLETASHLGFHFRVTLKDEKIMRSQDFIVLDSKSAGIRFRTARMETLNEDYAKKVRLYESTQKEYKEEVMEVASGYHGSLETLGDILAFLDVILSFATVSANAPSPFVRPALHARGSGILSFEQLRHPCVESQHGVSFIPNDIRFEKGKESFFIVTGPNMGGKSTFLRSVGVATLLAHIGCFVPAATAEISIVDAILARVGAGDCLEKGVSTFMAEMIEASFILKTATADSLVLIDELGRGTSTYDGFGLCWAISEHLAKEVDCYAVMATHFHELTVLADEVKSVVNVHVTALPSEMELTMLYKIERGPCDRSFGLHVAQVTDFPAEVVETARNMAKTLEDFSPEEDADTSEVAVERRKKEKQAGMSQIDDFLQGMSRIGKEYENDEIQLQKEAEALLQILQDSGNPFISHVLQ